MSIRLKVILPYLFLTLVVAITGIYVVTRLVTSSLSERLNNQLRQAGIVVLDDMARQEKKHLEIARIVAFTSGFAEAMDAGQAQVVQSLLQPLAFGLDADNFIIISTSGRELAHILKNADGSLNLVQGDAGSGTLPIVQTILESDASDGLATRGLAVNPLDGRYYYYTAAPVKFNDRFVGVVLVGTSLEKLMPIFRNTSLADVFIYVNDGQAIATTMVAMDRSPEFLGQQSIAPEVYQAALLSDDVTYGENFFVGTRGYSVARGPIKVLNDRIGVFAVVLPLDFVIEQGIGNRNLYVLLFLAVGVGVVLIGFVVSRLIIRPLYALINVSRAIASGDLSQRTGIATNDEIGILATTFDSMTVRLQERTEELQRTYRILEQMDRTKSSFIEVSAHELRTPLTLIKGYTQMLQIKAANDPEMEALTRGIVDGAERMTEIVNSMLDVSRIDSKTLKMMPEMTQVGLVILRLQKTFKNALIERRLTMDTEGLETLPPIYADPDLLYKVFYHLIINAIKYTPDGGLITISGRTIEETPGKPEVEIVVSDTGIGIAPQNHELIFEKFFQTGEVLLHSSGKTKFKGGGPGLGLAIARGIIEAHHGRIWVESKGYDEATNPGSHFHIRLPVNSEVVDARAQ
ncbi:MAG: ATP-binding protein [Anaerolineales bacterium]